MYLRLKRNLSRVLSLSFIYIIYEQLEVRTLGVARFDPM